MADHGRAGLGGLLLACLWGVLSERAHRQTQTLQKALALAQQRAQDAEQAHAAKADFLASMSHEIRSPLNSLMGMVDLSLTTPLDDTQRDYLTVAQQSSRMVLQLIDEILDDARLTSGQVRFEYQPVALQSFVQGVFRPHALAAPRPQVQFELSMEDGLPEAVLLDALRVAQVLNNLLNNAVKFTSEGFIRLSVTRQALQDHTEELVFSVSDSGPGIAPDQQALVFESFVQADRHKAALHPGTGLGLSISRRLAQGMQGRLELQSQSPPGATFSLFLPLTPSMAPAAGQQEDVSPAVSNGRTAPALRILLVEDQWMNQQVASAMLARLGLQVQVANDGAEAVQRCQAQAFDVVLMDVWMPVMDGLEATRQLRALALREGWGPLRIIGMTAQVQREAQARCLSAGMDDCLSKPLTLRQLSMALQIPLPKAHTTMGAFVDDDQELDLDRALDFALDASSLPTLIETFKESLASARGLLAQALHDQDAQAVSLQLHACKGFIPIFAGESLSQAIAELELQSKVQPVAWVQAGWEALSPRLDRLLWELDRARQRYHSG